MNSLSLLGSLHRQIKPIGYSSNPCFDSTTPEGPHFSRRDIMKMTLQSRNHILPIGYKLNQSYLIEIWLSLFFRFKWAKSDSIGFSQGEYSEEKRTFTFMRLAVLSTIWWWWIFALSMSRMIFLLSYSGYFMSPSSISVMKFSKSEESMPPSINWEAINLSWLMALSRLTE